MSPVKGYKKRNRTSSGVFSGPKSAPCEFQEEIVLRLNKGELFDPHVLMPHAELNGSIYRYVDEFVNRYRGETLTLSILTDTGSQAVYDTFCEVYRAHYDDEYQRITRYLKRRHKRLLILIAVSLCAFLLWGLMEESMSRHIVALTIMTNLGAFCFWETGYTQFDRMAARDKKKKILRARNAKIEFHASGTSGREPA